jgi:hypothetical protein
MANMHIASEGTRPVEDRRGGNAELLVTSWSGWLKCGANFPNFPNFPGIRTQVG